MNWQWIVSLALLGIATLYLIAQYVYVLFFHKIERDGSYSFPPFLFGIMIFIGVVLLPLELPISRWIIAPIALCLDLTIPLFVLMFIRGEFKQE